MMQNSAVVKLSGHHLRAFFDDYIRKIDYGTENMVIAFYGEEFLRKTKELWLRLKSNPEMKVMIVSGGDDICKICRFADDWNEDCNIYYDRMKNQDKNVADEFGLEIEKLYSVNYITQVFDVIKKNTLKKQS